MLHKLARSVLLFSMKNCLFQSQFSPVSSAKDWATLNATGQRGQSVHILNKTSVQLEKEKETKWTCTQLSKPEIDPHEKFNPVIVFVCVVCGSKDLLAIWLANVCKQCQCGSAGRSPPPS